VNICLTNRCSRRCEYCFQKEWFLESPDRPFMEMPIEMAKEIIDMAKVPSYGVLGGEPLLYSHLDEFYTFGRSRKVKFGMLSNITVPTEILKHVIDNYLDVINGWLINTDYTEGQKDLFETNLKMLNKVRTEFSLGTTFLPDPNCVQERVDRINALLDMCVVGINKSVRISTTTPTHNDKYKRFDYTQMVQEFVEKIIEKHPDTKFHFDCPTCACEVNPIYVDKMSEFVRGDNHLCCEPLLDMMPDGKVYWCSSATFFCVDDFHKYKDVESLKEALLEQWKTFWREKNITDECRDCQFFQPGYCYGLCSAKRKVM